MCEVNLVGRTKVEEGGIEMRPVQVNQKRWKKDEGVRRKGGDA